MVNQSPESSISALIINVLIIKRGRTKSPRQTALHRFHVTITERVFPANIWAPVNVKYDVIINYLGQGVYRHHLVINKQPGLANITTGAKFARCWMFGGWKTLGHSPLVDMLTLSYSGALSLLSAKSGDEI